MASETLKNRSDAVTDEDIEKTLGMSTNGTRYIREHNKLWFNPNIHFDTSSAEEQRNMYWGDIKLTVDGEGQNILNLLNVKPKLEPGKIQKMPEKSHQLWLNPENISRCPVVVYKKNSLL